MNTEQMADVTARAAVHAALADPARLLITDTLAVGDVSPSELAAMLGMPSNLLAHHLHVLEQAGLLTRRRSEGDRRRSYLRLVPGALDSLSRPPARRARRVLFVCTANSARSHLAAALWRRASKVPAASAGTHPAAAIAAGAIAAAGRHHLPLRRPQPRHISPGPEGGGPRGGGGGGGGAARPGGASSLAAAPPAAAAYQPGTGGRRPHRHGVRPGP